MAIGISLNVGLNEVTSDIFQAPKLLGCVKDAEKMLEIALSRGFDPNLSKTLLGSAATHNAVEVEVSKAAEILKPGDLFLFSFAGHGTFQVGGAATGETDDHDESIVLTDHFMMDDFWRNTLWPKFDPGVRIVAIADCCHSETAFLSVNVDTFVEAFAITTEGVGSHASASIAAIGVSEHVERKIPADGAGVVAPGFRLVPAAQREKELAESKAFYDTVLAASPQTINATQLFLSACKDDQKAADGSPNGAFTAKLLEVWDNGNFAGNYKEFMAKIAAGFGPNQTPTLTQLGAPDFSWQKPFTI